MPLGRHRYGHRQTGQPLRPWRQVLPARASQAVRQVGECSRTVVVAMDVGARGKRRVRVAEPGGEGHGVHLGACAEQGCVCMAEGVPGATLVMVFPVWFAV